MRGRNSSCSRDAGYGRTPSADTRRKEAGPRCSRDFCTVCRTRYKPGSTGHDHCTLQQPREGVRIRACKEIVRLEEQLEEQTALAASCPSLSDNHREHQRQSGSVVEGVLNVIREPMRNITNTSSNTNQTHPSIRPDRHSYQNNLEPAKPDDNQTKEAQHTYPGNPISILGLINRHRKKAKERTRSQDWADIYI